MDSNHHAECIWCGKPADSEEHLVSQWIDDALDHGAVDPAGKIRLRTGHVGGVSTRRVQRIATRKLAFPDIVCQVCNGGWMSRLENRVKPVLTPLIRGHQTSLTTQDQVLISTWASMKAVLLAATTNDHHVPENTRRTISGSMVGWPEKSDARPTAHTEVRIAAFDRPFSVHVVPPWIGDPINLWCPTIVIGHLVVRVAMVEGCEEDDGFFSAGFQHGGSSFTCWPPAPHAVVWPPRTTLDRAALIDFMKDFHPRIEINESVYDDDTMEVCQCGVTHSATRQLPVPLGATRNWGLK